VIDIRNALAIPSLLAVERSTPLATSYYACPLSRMILATACQDQGGEATTGSRYREIAIGKVPSALAL
jgi:hypothetical protein